MMLGSFLPSISTLNNKQLSVSPEAFCLSLPVCFFKGAHDAVQTGASGRGSAASHLPGALPDGGRRAHALLPVPRPRQGGAAASHHGRRRSGVQGPGARSHPAGGPQRHGLCHGEHGSLVRCSLLRLKLCQSNGLASLYEAVSQGQVCGGHMPLEINHTTLAASRSRR